MAVRNGHQTAIDFTYDYDARGLITAILAAVVPGNDRSYSYDCLGQLNNTTGPWGAGTLGLGNTFSS